MRRRVPGERETFPATFLDTSTSRGRSEGVVRVAWLHEEIFAAAGRVRCNFSLNHRPRAAIFLVIEARLVTY